MKNLVQILLSILFWSCQNNKEEKFLFQTQEFTTTWIKKNSFYPESYEPLGFSSFEIRKGSEKKYRSIKHEYILKNKEGVKIKNSHFFTFNAEGRVTVLTKERTNFLRTMEPDTWLWHYTFGDSFNNVDYGMNKEWLLKKYKDYLMIKNNEFYDISYLRIDCLEFLRSSINDLGRGKMERIISIDSGSKTSKRDLSELLQDLSVSYEWYEPVNFAIFQKDSIETAFLIRYKKPSGPLMFYDLNTESEFSTQIDLAFMGSNCFQKVLEF